MNHMDQGSKIKQAIFCISADEHLTQAASLIAEKAPGAGYVGAFRDYITADKRPHFSPALRDADSCVALVDFDQDPELAIRSTARLRQIFLNKISIVAVGSALETASLLDAVRAGCTEFLRKPVDDGELLSALARFQESTLQAQRVQANLGRVLVFFGAKGGVGTTILAVHLATFLVRQHGKKILLIDHKHQLGHVALYLGLTDTRYHFDELLRNVDRLDVELLNGFILHHESGLDVIPSPETAMTRYEGKADELDRVMDFLRREYDYILIDSWVGYQDSKVSLIAQADEIYLVSTPDVASLRDLARLVESMSLTEIAMAKLRLVLNRSTAQDSLTAAQIQKAIHFPVSIGIANNYLALLRAINEGKPILPSAKSVFNEQLSKWSGLVLAADETIATSAPKHKWKFSFRR